MDYNSDDSHYSVTNSDKDPAHPLSTPNIKNNPFKPSVGANLCYMPSEESNEDYFCLIVRVMTTSLWKNLMMRLIKC